MTQKENSQTHTLSTKSSSPRQWFSVRKIIWAAWKDKMLLHLSHPQEAQSTLYSMGPRMRKDNTTHHYLILNKIKPQWIFSPVNISTVLSHAARFNTGMSTKGYENL